MNESDALEAYLHSCDIRQRQLRASKATDIWLRRVAKHAVSPRLRGTARVVVTIAFAQIEKKKVRAILTSSPVWLHLGCGGEHKAGWTNIDLVGDPVDLAWNLASPLPFPDSSADAIFHEHLLEHLPLAAGAALLEECYRLLKPGGTLRIGVPDAGALIAAYRHHDDAYLVALHPGCPTRMLAVQELFYWHRHCTMFDEETLAFVFRAAGFPQPRVKQFGDSALSPAPDTPRRRLETLYMEATK